MGLINWNKDSYFKVNFKSCSEENPIPIIAVPQIDEHKSTHEPTSWINWVVIGDQLQVQIFDYSDSNTIPTLRCCERL